MNFYYRSLPDGRREVVCTRCFLTIGAAADMDETRQIEGAHQCVAARNPAMRPPAPPVGPVKPDAHRRIPFSIDSLLSATNGIHARRTVRSVLLMAAAAVFLYVLPNQFEFMALRHWNPYVSSVLPGDMLGCAFLCIFFRKVKAGVSLYCALTAFEASFLGLHIMPLSVLPWFTDLVPTVVVSAMVLRIGSGGARLTSIS